MAEGENVDMRAQLQAPDIARSDEEVKQIHMRLSKRLKRNVGGYGTSVGYKKNKFVKSVKDLQKKNKITYKKALQLASIEYRKKNNVKTKPKQKRPLIQWINHLKLTRLNNPNLSYDNVRKLASNTYQKQIHKYKPKNISIPKKIKIKIKKQANKPIKELVKKVAKVEKKDNNISSKNIGKLLKLTDQHIIRLIKDKILSNPRFKNKIDLIKKNINKYASEINQYILGNIGLFDQAYSDASNQVNVSGNGNENDAFDIAITELIKDYIEQKIKVGGRLIDGTRYNGGIDLLYPAKKAFQLASNLFRKKTGKGRSRPLEVGELHYGRHNYTGPGTRIEKYGNYPPFNDIDNCSKLHDIAYSNANKEHDPKKVEKLIRQADIDAVNCYNKYPNEDGYFAAKLGINGKMALENVFPTIIKSIAPTYFGSSLKQKRVIENEIMNQLGKYNLL